MPTTPQMPNPDTTANEEPTERAYELVELREFWGALSLAFFIAAIFSRKVVGVLPFRLQGWNILPPLAVWLVPAFSFVGMIFGRIGGKGRLSRFGWFANLAVFCLSALLLILAFAYFASR